MNNATILAVGEVQDLDVPRIGQVPFDPVDASRKGFLAVNEPRIDGKLAPLKPSSSKKLRNAVAALRWGLVSIGKSNITSIHINLYPDK